MHEQKEVPTRMQPLYKAVRPEGVRDEFGAVGEALCQLAEALEKNSSECQVPLGASPAVVWGMVDDCIKMLAAENSFRARHRVALDHLEKRGGT
jgi:hypothetical protein